MDALLKGSMSNFRSILRCLASVTNRARRTAMASERVGWRKFSWWSVMHQRWTADKEDVLTAFADESGASDLVTTSSSVCIHLSGLISYNVLYRVVQLTAVHAC
jgi:hypothetical protein